VKHCIYMYRPLGGRCHSRLNIGSNQMEEENELNPPTLPHSTVDKSVLRMNITITFVPTKIFEYYISLFQHNSNIDILRLRTDARSFSDASHGGSTHTEDMQVRLSESYWEAMISSNYFNWYVIDFANNKPYSYFVCCYIWHVCCLKGIW